MTVYAPTDVRAITVPDSFGGCGQPHESGELSPGERWALDCLPCEQALTSAPLNSHGWANRIDQVALTPDERQLLETQEKEGSAATAMMVRQLGDTLASALRQGYSGLAGVPVAAPQPAAPSAADLAAALKTLPADDLADLLKIAGLSPATDEVKPVLAEPPAAKKAVAPVKKAAPAS